MRPGLKSHHIWFSGWLILYNIGMRVTNLSVPENYTTGWPKSLWVKLGRQNWKLSIVVIGWNRKFSWLKPCSTIDHEIVIIFQKLYLMPAQYSCSINNRLGLWVLKRVCFDICNRDELATRCAHLEMRSQPLNNCH